MEKVTVTFKGEQDEVKIDFVLDEEKDVLDYHVEANPKTPSDKSKLVYFFASSFMQTLQLKDEENTVVQDDSGQ